LKRRNCLFYGIVMSFSVIVLVWGAILFVLTNSYIICFGTPFPSFGSVEHNAYFKFPSSAHNIEYDANGVNRKAGCTIWVKFEMDSAEFNTFVQTTAIHDLSASASLTNDAFSYISTPKGWNQPTGALAGRAQPQRNADDIWVSADQWIVVDVAHPNHYIVYLIVNQEWL